MFDPYSEWLDISKEQRPITYYLLLGISPQERDEEAIEEAAVAQSEKVREYEKGAYAQACTRILREIEQAKNVLLNPAKRRDYDALLRKRGTPSEEPEVVVAEVVADDESGDEERPQKSAREDERRRRKGNRKPEQKSAAGLLITIGSIGAIFLLAGGAVGGYLLFFNNKEPDRTPVAERTQAQSSPPPSAPKAEPPNPSKTEPPKSPAPPLKSGEPAQPPMGAIATLPAAPNSTPANPGSPSATIPNPAAPAALNPPSAVKPAEPKPQSPPIPKPWQPRRPADVAKLPMPDQAAQAKSEQALKETYKADYEKIKVEDSTGKTKPEVQTAMIVLSAKLLQPGRENRNDPAGWFVLLREARDLAIQAKRPRLAMEAIDEMNHYFQIDLIDTRIKAITAICKNGNEFEVAGAFRTVLNLIQMAYSDENFDVPKKYIEIIEAALRNVKAVELLRVVQEQKAEIEKYTKEFQDVTQARAKLAKSPADAEANLSVGRYLCFFQADWDKGLPMLAKGSEKSLKALAAKDLSLPGDVKEQLDVADGWWGWAVESKDRIQRNIMQRARAWYERAGPNTQGADRNKVINKIMDAQRREYARFLKLTPGTYYGRDPENRVLLLREGGGNMKSEEAIEHGLEWLAKHQAGDGHWSMNELHKTVQNCTCEDAATAKRDIAGTAFGLLPFLGAGETHKRGRYRNVVERGIFFLGREQQKRNDGSFHDNAYENALATIAMCEAYGLSRDPQLKLSAQAAVDYIVRAQDTGGSWGYSKNTKGDTSVSGWQFTALKAASFAGLKVSQPTFDLLSSFLDSVADQSGLGYGYNSAGNGPATSAVGLLCREFLSWGPGHPGVSKGIDFLLQPGNVPTKENFNIYSVYYITQVAHHYGGPHWDNWNEKVRDLLIELQDKGDVTKHTHQKGSWSPWGGDPSPPKVNPKAPQSAQDEAKAARDAAKGKHSWAEEGGRLMFTSLAIMTLETYYYHIPLYGYGPFILLE
ncbi:MAG TPA: hypothetical protein VGZ47_05265 [Gemmataceae bacterium]|jgi:cytoskeletal protein RodZ|nr:hypothetical protein [Gemmataceae bacterium]